MTRPSNQRRRVSRWRPFLWRWHRRSGVLAAIILVLVALSGILLNHTAELALGKTPVQSGLLLSLYGVEVTHYASYRLGDDWLSGDSLGHIYFNRQRLQPCNGAVVGALRLQNQLIAACREELLLLNLRGELIERVGVGYDLPVPLVRVGLCQQQLCLESRGQVLQADLQQLQWRQWRQDVSWSQAVQPPAALEELMRAEAMIPELSWERVLLDLHSGRLGGRAGVWLVDAAAVIMIFLCGSGFWLWWQQLRRKRVRN